MLNTWVPASAYIKGDIRAGVWKVVYCPALGYPHTSAIRGTEGLRELRPRQGRSPWRGLYRQVGAVFVLAAVAPEAERDPRRFRWSCEAASERLHILEEE
jgi:hypothetical protein